MNAETLIEKLAAALLKVQDMNERGYLSYLGIYSTEKMVDGALIEYNQYHADLHKTIPFDTQGPAIEGHEIAVVKKITPRSIMREEEEKE